MTRPLHTTTKTVTPPTAGDTKRFLTRGCRRVLSWYEAGADRTSNFEVHVPSSPSTESIPLAFWLDFPMGERISPDELEEAGRRLRSGEARLDAVGGWVYILENHAEEFDGLPQHARDLAVELGRSERTRRRRGGS